jgi:hypothetical protein
MHLLYENGETEKYPCKAHRYPTSVLQYSTVDPDLVGRPMLTQYAYLMRSYTGIIYSKKFVTSYLVQV